MPRWGKLRPKADNRQHGKALQSIEHDVQKFQGRRVGPVYVLPDQQHRSGRSGSGELVHESGQGPLPLLLRRHVEGRVTNLVGDGQQGCDQRDRLASEAPPGSEVFEVGQPLPASSLKTRSAACLKWKITGHRALS